MFKKIRTQKLDSRVKYQQPQFRRKLADARRYKRPVLFGFWSNIRVIAHTLRRHIVVIFVLVVLIGTVYAVSFVPALFFIRSIEVRGGNDQLRTEVTQEVERYLSGRVFLFLPRRNILFFGPLTLSSYITTANSHVWRVSSVARKFPHALQVEIVPREAAFVLREEGREYIIANDGTVLPQNEPRPDGLLLLSGKLARLPTVGERYFDGDVLGELIALRDFSRLTGLAAPRSVELVPVTRMSVPRPPSDAPAEAQLPPATNTVSLPQLETLDVPPDELKIHVPAGRDTSEFTVLVRVDSRPAEALLRLKELLSVQSEDRRAKLRYVDMRLKDRAFVCLIGSPCASAETIGGPPSIK
jgi:cell division septal protein FtsQ